MVNDCIFARRSDVGVWFIRGGAPGLHLPQIPALNVQDATQACSLPSATASSAITQDYAIRQVSDCESAACDTANQNSCCGCEGNLQLLW